MLMKKALFFQTLRQMQGIIALERRYHGALPDIDNFQSPIAFSLPFTGEWTVVNGGVTQSLSHSWNVPTQRYAYDFLILDAGGHSSRGAKITPDAFYCYEQPILAPADGVVSEMLDGAPDSPISRRRRISCLAPDLRGNYILLHHGGDLYTLLAHLKANSLRVTIGQRVKRSDILAACGNSGNSSEPHLHLQLQQGADFYTAPGLPMPFENIAAKRLSSYARFDLRPLPAASTHFPPYIERGMTVCNLPR